MDVNDLSKFIAFSVFPRSDSPGHARQDLGTQTHYLNLLQVKQLPERNLIHSSSYHNVRCSLRRKMCLYIQGVVTNEVIVLFLNLSPLLTLVPYSPHKEMAETVCTCHWGSTLSLSPISEETWRLICFRAENEQRFLKSKACAK